MSMLAGIAIGAAGCRDSSPPGTNPPASEDAGTSLELLARIGDDGGPRQELFRVYAAVLRPGGGVAVGNSGTGEVRFYDAHGTFVSSTGREGSGPGEFRSINWIGSYRGDSILVYDMGLHRFSVLDPTGAFARSFSPPADVGKGQPLGVTPDGRLVIASEHSFDPRSAQGLVRDTVRLMSLDLAGEGAAALGTIPGSDWLSYRRPNAFATTRVPFGRWALVELVGERVAHAGSDSDRISFRPVDGEAEVEVRVPAQPRALTREEIDDALANRVQDPLARSALQDHFSEQGQHQAPVIADLSAGGDGTLWLKLSPPSRATTARWLRYSQDGQMLHDVSLPITARLLDSAGDTLVVREEGSDGTEQLALYRVPR